jgi:hypothetical protein
MRRRSTRPPEWPSPGAPRCQSCLCGFTRHRVTSPTCLRGKNQPSGGFNELLTDGLAERPTLIARSSEADQSVVATLTARIETLEADFSKVEAAAAMHRADFERERERCERLVAEVLKATAELMAAREATARIAGELAALQARPWWRRLAA